MLDRWIRARRSCAARDEEDGEPTFVSRAHGELLSAQGAMSAFTLPLSDADDQVIGAILLEHRDIDGIPAPVRDRARAIAALVGPILHQKRLNDRSWPVRAVLWLGGLFAAVLGPARLGLKLTVLALAAAAYFFSTATTAFEVTADARLEGQVQRIISAPFDGYLVDQAVRPGDRVTEGAILAQHDDRDIRLQLLSTEAQLRQRLVEMNAAVAEGRRTDQALLDAQIARTVLRAPFAGVIVSGDRTQQLGAAVSRGEELFVVAPLDDYRLRLAVAEGDIAEIAPDQAGQVRFAARPDDTFGFTINRIMSVAEVGQGLNRFAVEGAIAPDGDRQGVLLPGMEGVARIGVDERLLIRVWTQDALDWLRLALWRWIP
ncbi:MAG: HlyD family efflux transporter periplasmic adaptor subunit [Roseovarius sp.]|nr:HlyD family efflux transporter periplasmic adaptor subunit [Roseovarius sp.]